MDLHDQLLGDMCTSYWLKDAIRALDKRDPLDAIRDAELLLKVAKQRWAKMRPE